MDNNPPVESLEFLQGLIEYVPPNVQSQLREPAEDERITRDLEQSNSMISHNHEYLCMRSPTNSKLSGTTKAAEEYLVFRNQPELEMDVNAILQKTKSNKNISIIRDCYLLKQSENTMKIMLVSYDKSTGTAVYLLYISIFQIKVTVKVYLQRYKTGDYRPQFQGGNGDIYFNDKTKQCVKAVRLKQGYPVSCLSQSLFLDGNNPRHQDFVRVMKEWAICTIAGAIGVGPNTIKYSNLDPNIEYDICLFEDYVTFKMQQHIPLEDFFQSWITTQVRKKKLKQMDLHISKAIILLHELKIIHGDIKPSNMVYDDTNKKFLLCDFGLSRAVPETYLKKTFMTDIGGCRDFAARCLLNLLETSQAGQVKENQRWINLFYVDLVALKKSFEYIIGINGQNARQRTINPIRNPQHQQNILNNVDITVNTTVVVRGLNSFTGRVIQTMNLGNNIVNTKLIFKPPKQPTRVGSNISKYITQRMGYGRVFQLANIQEFLLNLTPRFLDEYAEKSDRIESWLQIKNTSCLTYHNLQDIINDLQKRVLTRQTPPNNIEFQVPLKHFQVDYLRLWRQLLSSQVSQNLQKQALNHVAKFAETYESKQCICRYLAEIASWTQSGQLFRLCMQRLKAVQLKKGIGKLSIAEVENIAHLLANSALESLTSLNRIDSHLIQKVNIAQELLQETSQRSKCPLNSNSTYGLILLIKAIFYTCIHHEQRLAIEYSWHAYCVIKDCFGVYSCYYQSIVYNLFLLYRQKAQPIEFKSVADCLRLTLTQKGDVVTLFQLLEQRQPLKLIQYNNLQSWLNFLKKDTQEAISEAMINQKIYYQLPPQQLAEGQAKCAKSHVWLMDMAFPFHCVETQRMLNKVLQRQNNNVVRSELQIKLSTEWRRFQQQVIRFGQQYPKFIYRDKDSDNLTLIRDRIKTILHTRPIVRFNVKRQEFQDRNQS